MTSQPYQQLLPLGQMSVGKKAPCLEVELIYRQRLRKKSSDCEDQDSVPDSCGGNRTCCDAVAAESGVNSSPSSAAPPLQVLTSWSQSATSAGEQRDPQLSGRAQPAAVHLAGRTESPASHPKDAREAQ